MRSHLRWRLAAILIVALVGAGFLVTYRPREFQPTTISADGYNLAGYLSEGRDPSGLWVIFVHGNRSIGQDHLLYRRLVRGIRRDVSVLAIDMRGFGSSSPEGLESADYILDRTGDIEAAVSHLKAGYGIADSQIILIGHSLGALQVLKAGQSRMYRAVISIGPGDMGAVVGDPISMRSYADKLRTNMDGAVSPETIAREAHGFTPEALFTPCPLTPVILVFGQFDLEESLRGALEEIPPPCQVSLRLVTVPLSDHMYWTELGFLHETIRSSASWLAIGMLLRNVNGLLASSPTP